MIYVISSSSPSDIDTLACAVVYAELLTLQGTPAQALINGQFTGSVTKGIWDWGIDVLKFGEVLPEPQDEFVIVDFSDTKLIPPFADPKKVLEVIDHHVFKEEHFWQDMLGDQAQIVEVGSCASLIWEKWQKSGLLEELSKTSARLLYAAIISNNLNMQSAITNDLDRAAEADLRGRTKLDEHWVEKYYAEVTSKLLANPQDVLKKDTKLNNMGNEHVVVGQLELFAGSNFVKKYLLVKR